MKSMNSYYKSGLLVLGLFAIVTGGILHAETEQTLSVVRVEKISKDQINLYPKKDKVPGFLWGTNDAYVPGMLQLRVRCMAPAKFYIENSEGDEEKINAHVFRVEAWRMNDDEDWEFSGWYAFEGHQKFHSCYGLLSASTLLNNKNQMDLKIVIKTSGYGHRSIIKSWEIKN